MNSVRLRSAPSPAHGSPPVWTSTFADSPETVAGTPGSLLSDQDGAPLLYTSTRIPRGCSDCSGGPHAIELPLVVHGGDSRCLLKLPIKSGKEPGIPQA